MEAPVRREGRRWAGTEIMHHAYRARDGRGRPTVLTDYVRRHFGEDDLYELAEKLYRRKISHRQVWLLTPLLFEAACEEDEVACELVRRIGSETGVCASAMMKKLGLDEDEIDVVLGGSVFKGRGRLLIDSVREVVNMANSKAQVVLSKYEPVVGAAMLALERSGAEYSDGVLKLLELTIPEGLKITYEGGGS